MENKQISINEARKSNSYKVRYDFAKTYIQELINTGVACERKAAMVGVRIPMVINSDLNDNIEFDLTLAKLESMVRI